jgi:nucleoside-triphosphatase THEP1
MADFDTSNIIFKTAASFVNQTSKHIFLTGKAGTGKTTFLKYIRENSFKKMIVVAPTGVAAINAGGVTIHSFFQIPPGTFLPVHNSHYASFDGRVNNYHTLFKNMRMNAEKIRLLRELELLVIDEISMVRCDLLDAMDAVLRNFRRQPSLPFGGVQVLYIGDLFQLSPVAKNDEWEMLKEFYRSPFFFDALVMQQAAPVFIELKKIYRQQDEVFITVLNNIRNNCCEANDLSLLHQYYRPEFFPTEDEHFITLTTHNSKADAINSESIKKLPGKLYKFPSEITGEFSDRSFPADEILLLKEGAQVMFIKNDSGEERRFFNGRIGVIHSITDEKIMVSFAGDDDLLELEKETWKNIKYHYHKEKDKIEEEELGTFSQYPIRLAWAITIHKSQGLTFTKAIIDAGASFAPGQVYVALSRLTGLQGLVLKSRIHQGCIQTDRRVLEFVKNELTDDVLQKILEDEQQQYMQQTLINGFGWENLVMIFQQHADDYEHRQLPEVKICIEWVTTILSNIENLQSTGAKFKRQLAGLFETCMQDNYKELHDRTSAACAYFIKETEDKLLSPLAIHIAEFKSKSKTKKYLKELAGLQQQVQRKKQQFENVLQITSAIHQTGDPLATMVEALHQPVIVVSEEVVSRKKIKGETQRISLQLFKEGKSILQIAQERSLAQSTIEGHLAGFIITGDIDVSDLVNASKLEKIMELLNAETVYTLNTLKEKLGADFSFGEIRAATQFFEKEKLAADNIQQV